MQCVVLNVFLQVTQVVCDATFVCQPKSRRLRMRTVSLTLPRRAIPQERHANGPIKFWIDVDTNQFPDVKKVPAVTRVFHT